MHLAAGNALHSVGAVRFLHQYRQPASGSKKEGCEMTKRKSRRFQGRADACELTVASELLFANKKRVVEIMPKNYKDFDLLVCHTKRGRICVKSRLRSHIDFRTDGSDWLAIVLVERRPHRFFIIPHEIATKHSNYFTGKNGQKWRTISSPRSVPKLFAAYEDNFALRKSPKRQPASAARLLTRSL